MVLSGSNDDSPSHPYISPQELEEINQRAERWQPQDVLAWAFKKYEPDIVLACSFGGTSGMALLDMAAKLNP